MPINHIVAKPKRARPVRLVREPISVLAAGAFMMMALSSTSFIFCTMRIAHSNMRTRESYAEQKEEGVLPVACVASLFSAIAFNLLWRAFENHASKPQNYSNGFLSEAKQKFFAMFWKKNTRPVPYNLTLENIQRRRPMPPGSTASTPRSTPSSASVNSSVGYFGSNENEPVIQSSANRTGKKQGSSDSSGDKKLAVPAVKKSEEIVSWHDIQEGGELKEEDLEKLGILKHVFSTGGKLYSIWCVPESANEQVALYRQEWEANKIEIKKLKSVDRNIVEMRISKLDTRILGVNIAEKGDPAPLIIWFKECNHKDLNNRVQNFLSKAVALEALNSYAQEIPRLAPRK